MKNYNPDMILSFKCSTKIEKEATLQRVYYRHNRLHMQLLPVELTTKDDVVIVSSELITDLRDNSPHGFTGSVKPGYYRINKVLVELTDAHCVYNGVAYVKVTKIHDTKEDIRLLFNSSENELDRENKRGAIDKGMYEICKVFCDLGFNTVYCCSGHEKHKAYIKFSTNINYEELEKLVYTLDFVEVKHIKHGFGQFEYIEIRFNLTNSNREELIGLKEKKVCS